jgi:asparagine synthase (glutamine-hydrolysing)
LALRQPPQRKIQGSTQKWLLRKLVSRLMPGGVVEAPKRPLQTPQREWLRGELRQWAEARIETSLERFGGQWFDNQEVRLEWEDYQRGASDNSFYIWQWINLGLCCETTQPMAWNR